MKHVHIGGGQLGLGLICEVCHDLGQSLTIVRRNSPSPINTILGRDKKYECVGANGNLRVVDGFDFVLYDETNLASESSSRAINSIREADIVSVSVGLKSLIGPNGVSEMLFEAFKSKETPSCLFAFENLKSNSSLLKSVILQKASDDSGLKASLEKSIFAVDTISDRVCVLQENEFKNNKVCVWVENSGEIVFLDNAGIVAQKFDIPSNVRTIKGKTLRIVTDPALFKAFELRKLYSINAIHLALAAISDLYNVEILSECLQRYKGAKIFVEGCQREIVEFLSGRYANDNIGDPLFSKEGLTEYSASVLERFKKNTHDTVLRILKDLSELRRIAGKVEEDICPTKVSILKSLSEKLSSRLGEPIRELGWNKSSVLQPHYLSLAMAQITYRTNKYMQDFL